MSTPMQEWKEYSKFLSEKITNHLTPVLRKDVFGRSLYHVSTNPKIPVFIPQVSARTLDDEDVRVPRICTAPTLLACFVGYGALWADFYSGKKDSGKWTIYDFDFELAFLAGKKLLPDQRSTDEHWLITYSKKTGEYRPSKVGLIKAVACKSRKVGETMVNAIEFVVDIRKDSIYWSADHELKRGYWHIVVSNWIDGNTKDRLKSTQHTVTAIDRKQYDQLAGEKLSMLAFEKPLSADWGL